MKHWLFLLTPLQFLSLFNSISSLRCLNSCCSPALFIIFRHCCEKLEPVGNKTTRPAEMKRTSPWNPIRKASVFGSVHEFSVWGKVFQLVSSECPRDEKTKMLLESISLILNTWKILWCFPNWPLITMISFYVSLSIKQIQSIIPSFFYSVFS